MSVILALAQTAASGSANHNNGGTMKLLLVNLFLGSIIIAAVLSGYSTSGAHQQDVRFEVPAVLATPSPTPQSGLCYIQAECEDLDRKGEGTLTPRSEASNLWTWHINGPITAASWIEHDFDFLSSGDYICFLRYSNDNYGPTEQVDAYVDGTQTDMFQSIDTGDGGGGWNNFTWSPQLNLGQLSAGTHTIRLGLESGDAYGFEFDVLRIGSSALCCPPVAVAEKDHIGSHKMVYFRGSNSYDCYEEYGCGIVQYHWDFGDGTSIDQQNPSHSYSHFGIFLATLTVADNDGLTATDTVRVILRTIGRVHGDRMDAEEVME